MTKRNSKPVQKDKPGQNIVPLRPKHLPDFIKDLEEVHAMKLHPNLPPLAPLEVEDESGRIDGPGIQNAIALCVICTLSVVLVGLLLGWPFLQSLFAGTAVSLFGLLLFWLVLLLNR